jgi:uncharacterized protein (DUF2267 family)
MRASAISAFDTTIQKSNAWIRDLMDELDWDEPQRAYHGLRAVLHALRDRLPLAEVADLSSQLPMLIRGVFFENWRPSQTPVADRTREEFFEHVYENFPGDMEVDAAELVRAVFWLLSNHISEGEIEDIVRTLPKQLRELWD